MIGARSGDQFGVNSLHSESILPSARRFPRVERDASLAPPYWIFTRWKNIFMSNADTFTMFVIVAKIEMTSERVLVRLPTEKKRPVVVKNFNVKENIFRGFSLGKTLRKLPDYHLSRSSDPCERVCLSSSADHFWEQRVGDRMMIFVSIEWNFQSLKPEIRDKNSESNFWKLAKVGESSEDFTFTEVREWWKSV